MNWTAIFRDAVPGIAGVTVYDKGHTDILGRYCIAKTMKLANGQTRTTQTNTIQRPAALRRARSFLAARAAMAGLEYAPGSGAETFGYKPILEEVAA